MLRISEGIDLRPIIVETHDNRVYCNNVESEPDGKPWYYDIKVFLKDRKYHESANPADKRTLRKLVCRFFLNGEILYKKSYDGILLRCVDTCEANRIMTEIHEGQCGPHMSGFMLARKILRQGYYWLTMETDCFKHVRKCHWCQIYADKINQLPAPLHNLTSPWPFSIWGMDAIGMIHPKASNRHRFILVAIDYFTKWVEAASFANLTKAQVTRFVRQNIVCRYGLPQSIITDNARNLNNDMMDSLCA